MSKQLPNPTEEELKSDLFNAIWNVIKTWDVNVPEYYEGYCSANGSHVKLILDAIKPYIAVEAQSLKFKEYKYEDQTYLMTDHACTWDQNCRTCQALGRIVPQKHFIEIQQKQCHQCYGQGFTYTTFDTAGIRCSVCNGTGLVHA